jgi:hypothetical protein
MLMTSLSWYSNIQEGIFGRSYETQAATWAIFCLRSQSFFLNQLLVWFSFFLYYFLNCLHHRMYGEKVPVLRSNSGCLPILIFHVIVMGWDDLLASLVSLTIFILRLPCIGVLCTLHISYYLDTTLDYPKWWMIFSFCLCKVDSEFTTKFIGSYSISLV